MRGNVNRLVKIFLFWFSFNTFMIPSCDAKKFKIVQRATKSFKNKKPIKIAKPKVQKKNGNKLSNDPKMNSLKLSKSKVESKINEVKKDIKEEQKVQKDLKAQIASSEAEIDRLNMLSYQCKVQLDEQNEKINQLEKLHEAKENEMKSKKTHLGQCIRLLYTAKIPDAFEILLESSSFDDIIDKAQVLVSITDRISELMHSILQDMQNISQTIKDIELLKSKYEENRQKYDLQQDEIKKKIAELDALYEESKIEQERLEGELDTESNELKKIQSEIDSYINLLRAQREAERAAAARAEAERAAKAGKTTTPALTMPKYSYSDKKHTRMLWPVKGFTRITSHFSDTVNRRSAHGAIDIGSSYGPSGRIGIYGQPVRAPIDMVITTASYGGNGGYGNLITSAFECNGRSYVIYFGHLSGIVVSKGNFVRRGTVIGYVGNTGFSTGPHLHFEIRENGKRIDPLSFPFDY